MNGVKESRRRACEFPQATLGDPQKIDQRREFGQWPFPETGYLANE